MSIPETLPSVADQAHIFAENGIPVHPLVPGTKKPLLTGWQHRATTDPDQVTRWWSKWPNANIGIPTGRASGIFVLDVDLKTGGFDTLQRYEHLLPRTRMIKTGGGGLQYYFLAPDEDLRNSAGKLGPGLDTRGDGGYVVAAGSVTQRAYKVELDVPMAPVPAWLVERLTEAHRGRTEHASGERSASRITLEDTSPILEGTRNRTLFEIGSSLRGKGQDVASIEDELHEQNRSRCTPALDAADVARIAKSIGKYAPGIPATGAEKGTDRVKERLRSVERYVGATKWSGMAEHSARDVLIALVKHGRIHGELHEDGVRVSISYRQLAEKAAVSNPTAQRAVKRLENHSVLTRDAKDRRENESGAFIVHAQTLYTSTIEGEVDIDKDNPPHGQECINPAHPYSAPRLRWSVVKKYRVADGYEYFAQRRLGKVAGKVIDTLEAHGPMRIADLADELQVTRARDLRRYVHRLVEAGIVEVRGDTVALVGDWPETLERERTITGEDVAERLQAERHRNERRGYALVRRRVEKAKRRHRRNAERSRSKEVSRT